MRLPSSLRAGLIVFVILAPGPSAQEHQHATGAEKLGTVSFATSCSAAAQPQFNRAVALLHSFEFGRAIEGFSATLTSDPSCAMADWGIALSRWGNPFAAGHPPGRAAAAGARGRRQRATGIGPKTDRERAYVEAVARLYADYETTINQRACAAYRDAMEKLAARLPGRHGGVDLLRAVACRRRVARPTRRSPTS